MEVGAWLRGLGLVEYAKAFAKNGVDSALLPEFSDETVLPSAATGEIF